MYHCIVVQSIEHVRPKANPDVNDQCVNVGRPVVTMYHSGGGCRQ
jgi:hypothetical protein